MPGSQRFPKFLCVVNKGYSCINKGIFVIKCPYLSLFEDDLRTELSMIYTRTCHHGALFKSLFAHRPRVIATCSLSNSLYLQMKIHFLYNGIRVSTFRIYCKVNTFFINQTNRLFTVGVEKRAVNSKPQPTT